MRLEIQKWGEFPIILRWGFLALCPVFCLLYLTPPGLGEVLNTEAGNLFSSRPPDAREKWSGLTVVSVEYSCDGDFSRDRAQEATVVKVGSIYSRSEIKESIERLYSLREFSSIEVDAKIDKGGVKITFILTKQVRTGNITLEGNQKLESDRIARVMRLKPGIRGQEYHESIARLDSESIEKLYRSQGFFNTGVSFTANMNELEKRADVTFKIVEGSQPVIRDLILLGTNRMVIKPDDLRTAMKRTRRGKAYEGQGALDSDAEIIEKMYRERGYIAAKVRSARALSDPAIIKEYDGRGVPFPAENLKESDLQNGSVVVVIEIEQGKKVEAEIEVVRENGEIEKGGGVKSIAMYRMNSINEPVLRKSAEDIRDMYRAQGYYLAEVEHEVLKDKTWNFGVVGEAEVWKPMSGASSALPLNSMLRVSAVSDKPQIQSPETRIDSDKYQKIQIRMRMNKGYTGRIYWINDKKEMDYRDFSLASDDQFHNYEIDMRTFVVTSRSLDNLIEEGVPDSILEKLRGIENQRFEGEDGLANDLGAKIGDQEDVRLILKHAEKYSRESWSGKITQLRFRLTDAPGTDVDVAWIRAKMTDESIPIVFTVTRSKSMRVKSKVAILTDQGKEPQNVKEIRKQMLTRKKHFLAFWPLNRYLPDGIFSETIFEKDLRAIIAYYKDQGYPQARVVQKEVNPDPEKGRINVAVTIYEGPKTALTEVILESDHGGILNYDEVRLQLPSLMEETIEMDDQDPLRVRYSVKSDKPFRAEDTVMDRSYLRSLYADKGYIAHIEAVEQFNNEYTEAVVKYLVTTGKQIRLDDGVEIRGNRRTRDRVIERELSENLMKDKIFNRAEIKESWQNLLDLGFLKSVNISTEPVGGADDLQKMIVEVAERNAISVNMHLGSDSTAAFRGGLEASHINLWGTGRQASGKVQVGTEGESYRFSYVEPWFPDRTTRGLIDIYRYSKVVDYRDKKTGDEKSYKERRAGGSAGISKRFYRINTFTLGYKYEVVDYVDINDGSDKTGKIGSIETRFQRDTRRNPMNPSEGWLNGVTLEYANKLLRGNETFAQVMMSNMFYSPLSQNAVLALGARTGYTWVLGGTKRVLTPKQFNLSDYTTPRGYKWTAEDAGNVMLNLSMELRFPIYKKLGGVIFFDSGYVFNEPSQINIRSMKSSVGAGLRFITPIGPVRLDYGYPVSDQKNRNKWPNIAFGHAF